MSDTFAASVKEVPNAAASIAALASSLADPPKNIAAVSALSAISFITCDGTYDGLLVYRLAKSRIGS